VVADRTEIADHERLREVRSGMLSQIRRTLDRAVRGDVSVLLALYALKKWRDPAPAARVLLKSTGTLQGPGAASARARRIMLIETPAVHSK
jgi:hypothetical protein